MLITSFLNLHMIWVSFNFIGNSENFPISWIFFEINLYSPKIFLFLVFFKLKQKVFCHSILDGPQIKIFWFVYMFYFKVLRFFNAAFLNILFWKLINRFFLSLYFKNLSGQNNFMKEKLQEEEFFDEERWKRASK